MKRWFVLFCLWWLGLLLREREEEEMRECSCGERCGWLTVKVDGKDGGEQCSE